MDGGAGVGHCGVRAVRTEVSTVQGLKQLTGDVGIGLTSERTGL